jgi:cob(I)alamin adenosyltransferase
MLSAECRQHVSNTTPESGIFDNCCFLTSRAQHRTLGKDEKINEHPRQYVNRLSDLMFVLARVLNWFAGGSDVLWQHERNR